MTRAFIRRCRQMLPFALVITLPALLMGCPKKPSPPAVEDAGAPLPASSPSVTELAPLTDNGADAGDAAPEAAPKKWGGPAMSPNQSKIEACCNAMRAQAKTMGLQSPEGFQLNAAAVQCDTFVKQVDPRGTAPEFAQVRELLKSVKLPAACQF
jgi:hypothetical protein